MRMTVYSLVVVLEEEEEDEEEYLPVCVWNVTARCVHVVFRNKAVYNVHVCCFVWSSI